MRRRTWIGLAAGAAILGVIALWLARSSPPPAETDLRSAAATGADAVFLIIVDTLRADRLSCYGYAGHATPNVDRLASLGVTFTHAQSVASWTRPSVASILTSLYPTQLGLVEFPTGRGRTFEWREKRQQASHILLPNVDTMAEILQREGFFTGAFVNQPALNHLESYQQGFREWFYPVTPDTVIQYDPEGEFRAQGWPTVKDADRGDYGLVRTFELWLSQRVQLPKLFAWVHLLTPHVPYRPPPAFAPPEAPEGTERRLIQSALYDGEVRTIDDMVGKLLDSIDRHVGLERSVIVFTSDHGEEFHDHEMHGHGHSLHREVLNVPLIIVGPTLPSGHTIEGCVRTIDILPTILDLAKGSTSRRGDMEGTTLAKLITGEDHGRSVYSEAMLYGSTERSLIEGDYKLMYDQQEPDCRLFNLPADPNEHVNLAPEQSERVAAMRRNLESFHTRLTEDYRLIRRQYFETANPTQRQQEEQRQRGLEALRALGYIGD
jgi:arylsulfatase A-like enzyme